MSDMADDILTEDGEFGGDNDDKVDGFVFDPSVKKPKSKHILNLLSLLMLSGKIQKLQQPKLKRYRATPTGTNETKVEKKSKTK